MLLTALSLAAACTAGQVESDDSTVGSDDRTVVEAGSAAHNDTSTPFNLASLPALIGHHYDGRDLRLGGTVEQGPAWTSHHLSYRSGDLTITGRLTLPRRGGPFPVAVLAHGYEMPATYRSGVTLTREQAYLASRGYAVLVTDYRNYGGSDHDGAEPVAHPLGYPEDVVNAIVALARAELPRADTTRVAVLGRSMGGGVALAAVEARPLLVDALVLYSPVSSRAADNYTQWVEGSGVLEEKVLATYGAPADNPRFWREASPRAYVGRVSMPVQIHHGTADPVCPPRWSRATASALRRAGADVEHFEYAGETHHIERSWPLMMRRMVRFLDEHV